MRWTVIPATAMLLGGVCVYWATVHFKIGEESAFNRAISLSPGHTHARFFAGYDARYLTAIEFDQPAQIQFDPHDCVTAEDSPRGQCDAIPTGFQGNWTLTEDGRQIRQGSVPQTMWRYPGSGSFSIRFPTFKAKRFTQYEFDLNVSAGGSALQSANPRLCVAVREPEFSFSELGGRSTRVVLMLCSAGSILIGSLLLGATIWEIYSPPI